MDNLQKTIPTRRKRYTVLSGIVIIILIALCLVFAPEKVFRFLQILYFFN